MRGVWEYRSMGVKEIERTGGRIPVFSSEGIRIIPGCEEVGI